MAKWRQRQNIKEIAPHQIQAKVVVQRERVKSAAPWAKTDFKSGRLQDSGGGCVDFSLLDAS